MNSSDHNAVSNVISTLPTNQNNVMPQIELP